MRKFFTSTSSNKLTDKRRQADVMHAVLTSQFWTIAIAGGAGVVFLFEEKIVSSIAIAIGLGASAAMKALLKKGYGRRIGMINGWVIWGITTWLVFISGGVSSADAFLYFAAIVAMGLTVGTRAAGMMAGISIITLLGMAIAENSGYIFPTVFPLPPQSRWLIFTIATLWIVIPLRLTLKRLEDAIQRGDQELAEREKAETALIKSEQRYRLISNVVSDYLFSSEIDENGQLVLSWVAGAFERITGYTFEEYVSLGGWRALLHPEDVVEDNRSMENLRSNQPIVSILRTFHKNGDVRWVKSYGHPVWDEKENKLVGIYGAVQDITEQKQIEVREQTRVQLLEKIIAAGKQVTRITDLAQCFREIHRSIKNDLGFDRVSICVYDDEHDIIRVMYGNRYTEDDPENTAPDQYNAIQYKRWQTLKDDPTAIIFYEDDPLNRDVPPDLSRTPNGEQYHLTLAAWAGDAPIALITVDNLISNQPITAVKINALQLFAGYAGLAIQNAQLNAQLEQRVTERTTELEKANDELESFNYTMAHDLRTPARAMIGFSTLLHESAGNELDEDDLRYLHHIMEGSNRMGRMIDELLDYFHLGRLTISLSEIDAHAVMTSIVHHHQTEIQARGIKVVLGELPACQADPILIRQVFAHLFENALKFTRPRKQPRIEIGSRTQNGKLVYFVQDNGVGFDMKYADKLFGVFQRLHLLDEFEGVGVGLAVVERILHRHGGSIWVDANVDKGATFYFMIGDD